MVSRHGVFKFQEHTQLTAPIQPRKFHWTVLAVSFGFPTINKRAVGQANPQKTATAVPTPQLGVSGASGGFYWDFGFPERLNMALNICKRAQTPFNSGTHGLSVCIFLLLKLVFQPLRSSPSGSYRFSPAHRGHCRFKRHSKVWAPKRRSAYRIDHPGRIWIMNLALLCYLNALA